MSFLYNCVRDPCPAAFWPAFLKLLTFAALWNNSSSYKTSNSTPSPLTLNAIINHKYISSVLRSYGATVQKCLEVTDCCCHRSFYPLSPCRSIGCLRLLVLLTTSKVIWKVWVENRSRQDKGFQTPVILSYTIEIPNILKYMKRKSHLGK